MEIVRPTPADPASAEQRERKRNGLKASKFSKSSPQRDGGGDSGEKVSVS